jgi:arylsulfatase A-like enzyme
MYDSEAIDLPDNPYKPENAPDVSMHNFGELRNYTNIPKTGPLSDSLTRTLIHGYYACVSYTDKQIGKVLSELKNLGLEKNTVVILWGDHGWNLGEHGLWCKHCNYETSLRAPIILKVPWLKGSLQTDALVEFVDIYPTLCDLAGLDIPGHVQGESLLKYMNDPGLPGKSYVFSRWYRGESVKNVDYRYTEWLDSGNTRFAEMLYDHRVDYAENQNISGDDQNADIIGVLREKNLANRVLAEQEIK